MSSVEKSLASLRLVVALLLLLSLGGVGRAWLSDGVLLGLLLLLFVPELVARARAADTLEADLLRLRAHWFEAALAVLALLGLGVRLLGIGQGLGHEPPDIDEHRLAQSVKYFLGSGTIDHSTVEHYPGLHFWMLSASFVLTYLWALMAGAVRSLPEVSIDTFVWAGRVTNALLEAGTIVLTGLLGRTVVGPAVGLTAAAAVAVAPISLEIGTQLRSDTALTFFAWACAYAAVSRAETPNRIAALVAGALAGCATAVKYSGVFTLAPVVLAFGLAPRGERRAAHVAIALLGFGAALATTNHYLWADLPNFLNQLATEVSMTGESHWAASPNPRWFYATTLAGFGLGWPLLALAVAFGAYGLAKPDKRVWLLLAFPLSYLWFMTHQPAQFPRWVYPLTPCMAILAMAGLVQLARLPGRVINPAGTRRRLSALIATGLVLAVTVPFVGAAAAAISWRITTPPYALAEAWLRDHAAPGDIVVSEHDRLDLRATRLRVTRVDDVATVLKAGDYQLYASHWIVVPEWLFGDPNLDRLDLAREFKASWALGGNRGTDYRIYSTRPLSPLGSRTLVLGTADAAAALGTEWSSDESGTPGLALPDGGARLFIPLETLEGRQVELDVLQSRPPPALGSVPVTLEVDGRVVPLESVGVQGNRVRLRSAPCPPSPSRARVTVLRLQRSSEARLVRVVQVVLG